jgi:hypothetical protein
MIQRTIWTERRFTGLMLIIGCILFLTAAGLTPRDEQGNYIYGLSLRDALIVTYRHWSTWHWGLILFCIAVVLTLLGFAQLATLLRDAGDRVFSRMGLIAFQLVVSFFLINMAFDFSIGFWAAQETASTKLVPDLYIQLSSWSDTLFEVSTALAFFAGLAYGVAMIATRILPRWLGWLMLVYNFIVFMFFAILGDMPPFVHYLLPIVIGFVLLLPRSQLTSQLNREKELSLTSSMVQ